MLQKETPKQINVKSIAFTVILVIILFLVIYIIMANFVTGPVNKNESDINAVKDKISSNNKTCKQIYRTSFKYVTYTCTSSDKYYVYDANGKLLLKRDKSLADFDKVRSMINDKYSYFKNSKIKIGYGRKNIAYVIEKDTNMLIIDFDSFKVIFNSGGE